MHARIMIVAGLLLLSLEGCGHHDRIPPAAPAPAALGSGAEMDASSPYALQCGTLYCDARSTYCETIKTDVPALPSNYSCKPLPDSCKATAGQASPTCACFPKG